MSDAVDYQSPGTRRTKRLPTAAELRILRKIYMGGAIVTGIAALWALWRNRVDPAGGLGGLDADLFFILVALLYLGTVFVLWLVRLLTFGKSRFDRLLALGWGLLPFPIALVAVLICEFGVPFNLAFRFSRAPLEREAAIVHASPALSWNLEL